MLFNKGSSPKHYNQKDRNDRMMQSGKAQLAKTLKQKSWNNASSHQRC